MLIQVLYKTGHYDMVRPETLSRLIESQEVDQFRRNSGWVRVGRDPMRKTRIAPVSYSGPNRRHEAGESVR